MEMRHDSRPSFSRGRRWTISLNVAISTLAVLALVTMVNYLAARHFTRIPVTGRAQTEFAPITARTLQKLTNEIKIIVYFDKDEPLFDRAWSLLKEYKFLNSNLAIEHVDYIRDPAAAQVIKAKYKLFQAADVEKNLIIFDCNGRTRIIYEGELSDLDIKSLVSGQSREIRRTHFKGETLFTSAIQSVTTSRRVKACFVQGHGEHRPDSDDKLLGYSRFANVLTENNIDYETLSLVTAPDVPADCNLLIIAGPTDAFLAEETEKVARYLKQGGRMFILFNHQSVIMNRPTGLEKLLADWGVVIGRNVVLDSKNAVREGNDFVVTDFGDHPMCKPLTGKQIYVLLPRGVGKLDYGASAADAPKVEVLARTSPGGRVITDIRSGGAMYESPADFVGPVPLAVAVEKGTIRGVSADRGSTRIVVTGDSHFLRNGTIESVANLEFATYAVNWLLARNELLVALAPRPIKEYKLSMTRSQQHSASWILLAGMPGSVLGLGFLVWLRRRT